MMLATIRDGSRTAAVRVDGDLLVETGQPDVDALLAEPGWRDIAAAAAGATRPIEGADFAAVVQRPGKILCVGLNYRNHILEMGRELPEYPTLFAKFSEALIGPYDEIRLPPESDAVDWEAELAVVIGGTVRRATTSDAEGAIAGFAILNDVTLRDWQYRTPMWDQGKTWADTTPLGPFLVTPDDLPGGMRPHLDLQATVNDEIVQKANTGDLVFEPVRLVEYVSTILTLRPGDVIATGTPGGVGHARKPARYLGDGDVLGTEIECLGSALNRAVSEQVPVR